MNKAVILDRDGTINVEKNYLYRIEEFQFIKGVPQTIKLLNENNYKVIVATNQAGVARGYYTEESVIKLHNFISEELKKYDAYIDDYFYCPHHPDAGIGKYKVNCACRKPNAGLYLAAMDKWAIDPNKSYVIGDKITDLIPGKLLGMQTILVETGYGKDQNYDKQFCDYKVKNINKIVKILL